MEGKRGHLKETITTHEENKTQWQKRLAGKGSEMTDFARHESADALTVPPTGNL